MKSGALAFWEVDPDDRDGVCRKQRGEEVRSAMTIT
jgi:hypothetical protein